MTDEEKRKEKEYLKQEAEKARKEEWEKIRSLGAGARVRYFWDYYKFVLVIAFFVIMAVYIIVNMIVGSRTETLLYTSIMNVGELDSDSEGLAEDFEQSIGGIGRWKSIQFDLSMRIDPDSSGTSQADVANTMKMTALLQTGTLDVCIAPPEVTKYLQEQGMLMALDELPDSEWNMGSVAEEYLYYAPEPLYDEETGALILPETEDDESLLTQTEAEDSDEPGRQSGRAEHLYAVRIDQAGILERYGIHEGNEVWFSVIGNSDHTQMASKLFHFLLGQA